MKLFIILITFFYISSSSNWAQNLIYQDIFKGGVCVVGSASADAVGTVNLPLIIEPNSSIYKIFMLGYRIRPIDNSSFLYNFLVDNDSININQFSEVTFIKNEFSFNPTGASGYEIHFSDITEKFIPTSNSINLGTTNFNAPNSCPSCRPGSPLIIILYKNQSLTTKSFSLFTKSGTEKINNEFSIFNSNNVDITKDIAFSIQTDRLGANSNDGYSFLINNNFNGILNQNDNTSIGSSSGVFGNYYYSDTFVGLTDDIVDDIIQGADGIMRLNNFFNNDLDNLTFSLDYLNNQYFMHNYCISYNITHSTPCNPINVTTSPDTLVCKGATVQLNASGGSTYHWEPSMGLSCVDCPNPVLTANSSRLYTVRIANNDSCSVVRPVKVNVQTQAKLSSLTMNTAICGNNNGKIVAQSNAQPIVYSLNNGIPQSSGTFQSLFSGNYTITLTDSLGCTTDSIVTVPEVNHTVASFSASPTTGTAPLSVQLTNTSVAASTYSWYVNNQFIGTQLPSYSFDTAGIYTIDLLAWKFDPSCADTATTTILVIDQLIVPTAFTPDKDQVNDTWEIANIDKCYPKNTVTVFNRWGAIVFESTAGSYSNNPWNGTYKGNLLPVGSYYFIIQPNDDITETITGSVSLIYR